MKILRINEKFFILLKVLVVVICFIAAFIGVLIFLYSDYTKTILVTGKAN